MEPYNKSSPDAVRMHKTEGNQANPPTTSYSVRKWTNTLSGVKYPGWRDAVKRHVSATTTCSGWKTSVVHSDAHLFVSFYLNNVAIPQNYREVSEDGWVYQSGGHNPPSLLANDAADADAAGKFYSKARQELHALQGGEMLGEMGKTASSVMRITDAMLGQLFHWKRNIRRARNAGPRRYAAGISDAYLEWKFGWDPLAKDVRALMNDFKNDYFESTEVRATGRSVPTSSSNTYTESLSIANYEVTVTSLLECTVRYIAELSLERTGAGGLVERLGLSPNNFVPTIYNLLPWTYMIDYFSNIGNIVNAVGFPTARIRWCNRTIRNSNITKIYAGANLRAVANPGTRVNYVAVPQTTTWTTTGFQRSGVHHPSFPSDVQFKMPSVFTELGRRQWRNVAAVIANRTWSRNGNLSW
jgi:hypothetical protein